VKPDSQAVLGDDRVADLRALLPATGRGAYLNTGTAGPLPTPVADAMHTELATQLDTGRSGPDHLERYLTLAAAGRAAVAPLLGCGEGEVALTRSTTEGMGLVTAAIDWRPGDEAVTTDLEHPGVLFPLYVARSRYGIAIRQIAARDRSDDAIVDAIAATLGPRTRLVSISHVSYRTGQILPVRAIADVVRRHGATLLVDGAQSFGAIEVDVAELGCDAYAVPGQKWLCGPEETGALYCRSDLLSAMPVPLASYGTAERYDDEGYVPHTDGRRLEFGTRNPIGFVGQLAAIAFLRDVVGVAGAAARAVGLASSTIEALGSLSGVDVLTPAARHATLVTARLAGVGAERAVELLAERHIFVRSIRELDAIRLSLAYFTTADERDRTVSEIAAVARSAARARR
jgi:L-cysteine/cystine lyase